MNLCGLRSYRPQTIDECILPDNIKKTFKDFLEQGEVSNLLLSGPPGCGKTTVAKALCNELGVDVYVINGSDEGRFLDTVRNNAKNFASTVSFLRATKHKVIIIDEADNTSNDVQLALRAFTEEFVGNCRPSSPVTTKTKSSNHFTVDVWSWIFAIRGKDKQSLACKVLRKNPRNPHRRKGLFRT